MNNEYEFIFQFISICSGIEIEEILGATPLELLEEGVEANWEELFPAVELYILQNKTLRQLLIDQEGSYGDFSLPPE